MKKANTLWALVLLICLSVGCAPKGSTWNEQGRSYYEEGDFEKARQAFQIAVSENPEDAGYYANLGMACIELKAYSDAADAFRAALALDDQNPYVYRGEGILFFRQEEYSQAVSMFDAAEKLAEKKSELLLDIRQYKAEAQIRAKDYVKAVYTYQDILQTESKNPQIWYEYGRTLLLAGEKDYASQAFDEMDKAGVKDLSTYLRVWGLLSENGYGEDGKYWLRKILVTKGDDEQTREARAQAAFLLEDYGRCVVELEAVGLNQLPPGSITYLAVSYLNLDRGEEALSLLQRLRSQEPDNGKVDEYIAEYYLLKEDYEKALASVQDGQKKLSGEARKTLDYYEAVCYEYLHEYQKALACFEAYQKTYGAEEKVTHEIQFLRSR